MKVTVIVPCYNYGKYLLEAVHSVLSQTFQDFDIIIVDDKSTDNSVDIIRSIKEPRVFSIFHSTNKGVSCARNTGIKQATGKYILTLDADDILHPTFLSMTVPVLDGKLADIAYTDIILFDKHKKINRRMPDYNFQNFLDHNQFCSSILFHKKHWEEVGGYNETFLDGYEDWEFGINMGSHGHFGYRIPSPLFYYRQKPGSRNSNARKNEWAIRGRLQSMYSNIKVS